MARYASSDMTKPRTSAGQAPAQAPNAPVGQGQVLAESASDLKIE